MTNEVRKARNNTGRTPVQAR